MSTTNGLPENFSGVAEFKFTNTDLITGEESVSTYTKHFHNGALHREDGPAILLDGKPHQHWIHGRQYTEEEFNQWLVKKHLNEKLQSTLAPLPQSQRGKI